MAADTLRHTKSMYARLRTRVAFLFGGRIPPDEGILGAHRFVFRQQNSALHPHRSRVSGVFGSAAYRPRVLGVKKGDANHIRRISRLNGVLVAITYFGMGKKKYRSL